jgi:hypothetical protein
MSIKELWQSAGNMDALLALEPQTEAMAVRLADMMRFKESYEGYIHYMLPEDGALSIADTDAGTAGLVFYDSSHLTEKRLISLPHAKDVESLWFVFVIDKAVFSAERLNSFIAQHRIRQRFQKLFLLDFFKSSLSTI